MGTYIINGERIHAASMFQAKYAYLQLMKSRMSSLPQDPVSRSKRTQPYYDRTHGAYHATKRTT